MISSTTHTIALERLQRLAARVRRREPALLSTTMPAPALDPVTVFREAGCGERSFFERSTDGLTLVGIGAAERLSGTGEDHCYRVADAWNAVRERTVTDGDSRYPFTPPVAIGGFAFDGGRDRDQYWANYYDALLVVPRFLFSWVAGSCWLTVNARIGSDAAADRYIAKITDALARLLARYGTRVRTEAQAATSFGADDRVCRTSDERLYEPPSSALSPDTSRARRRWRDGVRTIVEDIRRGTIQKQVLARRVHITMNTAPDAEQALCRLRTRFGSSCAVFAIVRGEQCFLGASPERLVRVERRLVRADCLAGSAARGRTPDEDRILANRLLTSPKERSEHALVIAALRDGLTPVCESIEVPEQPMVVTMPNVQHLHTPISGTLHRGGTLLELVARIHPTPAGGGSPRKAMLPRIRALEQFDRGWYAGPLGWIDASGSGEFVVAIRSALLTGIRAPTGVPNPEGVAANGGAPRGVLLYAGCGIVAGSDPDSEFRESGMKLAAVGWALSGDSHQPTTAIQRPAEAASY